MNKINRIVSLLFLSGLCIKNASCQNVSDKKEPKQNKISYNGVSVLTAIKKQTNDQGEFKCDSWSLTKDQVTEVLGKAKVISSHDFMYLYNVLPCEVNGEVILNNKKYFYSANAGSFVKLYTNDTTMYFGCSKDCEKYFLSTGGDPKRDLGE